ncbi:PIG-L family deacetylase [uncultured Microbacterium sp.]|uniref:PIG-L family deacetylase n=1 Tax=uncultured Microbacterium sp. TaxID=191216 RepID=UPI0025D08901|nr:PIG-L family deacetylase [uncultured Microbacterium sp.]
MSRASSSTSRPHRAQAGLIAAIAIAVVVVVAVGGVFAYALLRPEPAATSAPTPSPAATTAEPSPSASPTVTSPPPSPPAPSSPAAQGCEGSSTLLTIWAHPDDDIIFANPTISDAIAAGRCVRTVFVTAGDAGKGLDYVAARELGILRAYNAMRGKDGEWDATELTLDTGMQVRRLVPKDDPRLSVLYLRLPDGNLTGEGFDATAHATLSKLYDGAMGTLSPVDGGPAVTRDQLIASVRELASAFHPEGTLTHIPRGSAFAPGDHPDHSAVGTLIRDSLTSDAAVGPGIRYFVGYPSENLPANLEGAVLDTKVDTYRIYTQQDQVIRCADRSACLKTRKFGQWLQRSYAKAEADLQMG